MGIQINGQTDTVTATDGSINVGGDVTIPGVLTYEDVTNVDSVGIVTAQAGIRVTGGSIGIQKSNPLGKLHVYTDSLNTDGGYNGQNFGIVVETEDGNNDGDEGNGICFTQQYSADGIDSSKVRTGAIIGFKDQATGNFGGGLKFKVQPYGASPLRTSMVLDRSGNIGINSTNPSTPLELYTDISSAWKFRINTSVSDGAGFYQRSNGDFEMVLRDSSNNNNYIAGTSGALQFATSGSEKLRITSGGAVGIGTDNPLVKTHVVGPSSGGGKLFIDTIGTFSGTDTSTLGFSVFRGGSNVRSNSQAEIECVGDGNYSGSLVFKIQNPGTYPNSLVERLRITSSGNIGIGTDNPADILHLRNTAPILTTEATNGSSGLRVNVLGQTSDSSQLFRVQNDGTTKFTVLKSGNVGVMDSAPSSLLSISQTGGNAKLQIKRADTANNTDDYGSILWRSAGGTAVGGINVARATAENDGYMFFQTTESGSSMTERLRILSNGTIRKGTANGANGKQPIELFFQKRSTQIGKRVHQGSGVNATTHNILNIDSWQSANSHAFIYVTVYYVSPVANYGGRMECYAHAVNSGGNVSGGQGTFATSDAGRWGNPGVPSLSWSGSTLRFTTLAHAYIDYSLDITCIAYDGAVVSFYSN